MKPVLFIDRDGTLIREPADEQIDSFDKLEFYPGVFSNLKKICEELNYEIVMITNQDGLGTDAYPESSFWPVHNFMLDAFKNEGIVFDNQLIDRTFAKDNAPTRKPQTGLLTAYFSEVYDLKNSFVIGDRLTDIELAKNVGCQGIFMNDETHLGINEISVKQEELTPYISLETNSWEAVYAFLKAEQRWEISLVIPMKLKLTSRLIWMELEKVISTLELLFLIICLTKLPVMDKWI